MLRLYKEEGKGILCIQHFLSANIDPNNRKRILFVPAQQNPMKPVIYGIEFYKKESATDAMKTMFETGKLNLIELEDEIKQDGFVEPAMSEEGVVPVPDETE